MTSRLLSRWVTGSGRRTAAILAAAVLALTGAAGLADVAAGAAPSTGAAAGTAPVVIVLDASGSMNTADAPGPRIVAAKQAVLSLVRELPTAAEAGLLTYGTGTSSAPAARAAGCRDIHLLAPVRRIDKPALSAAVRRIRARGYTPIGAALRRAAEALPAGTDGSIVLVSDGEDTCAPPDPCTVARDLKNDDHGLIVHTVGFRVASPARRQLQCIAAATGGTYRDVRHGAALLPVLRTQVDAGMRPYLVTGRPILGTPTPTDAPGITTGQYADSLPASRSPVTRYYAIRLAAPETFYVTATVVPPALRGGGADDRLEVSAQVLAPDGHRCLPTQREHDSVLAGKVDPVSVLVSGVVGDASWSHRCASRGSFLVALTRDSASTTLTRTELVVRFEPPVRDSPRPVQAVPAGLPAPRPTGGGAACAGGASFDTAPLVPASTCRDDLSTGETRYYRVRLAWGQRLAYTVVVDRVPGTGHGVGEVRSAVTNPLRQDLTLASDSNAARDFGGPVSISLTGSTLVPVDYGNRTAQRSDIRPYSLAGDYYLTVGMSYPISATPYRTGVTVTVHVVGRPLPPPDYATLPSSSPTSSPGTPTVTSAPTASAGPSAARRAAANGASTGWIVAVIAAAALLGGGVLTWLTRTRSRT